MNDILNTKGPILIRASAGTGKTYTLTRKIIHLIIEEELDVDQVLALTFTDYAAAEMRERIYSAITDALGSVADPRKRHHLERQRIRFHRNQISTFHSFCMNLIRSYPDVAGLQTEIRLMDAYEEAQFNLAVKARFYQDHKRHPALIRTLMRFGQKATENLCSDLGDFSEQRLRELTSMTPSDWVGLMRLRQSEMVDRRDAGYAALRAFVEEHPDLLRVSVRLPESFPTDYGVYFTKEGGLHGVKVLSRSADPLLKEEANRIAIEMNADKDLLPRLNEWLQRLESDGFAALQDPDTGSTDPDTVSFHAMRDLADVILKWTTTFRDERLRTGRLVFDDLIHLVRRMVVENDAWVEEIRDRYRYIVVDEFQDTDAAQWDIVSKLMRGGNAGILLVGDLKQAIYEFRGGNVSVMQRVAKELAHTEFKLEETWRSAKEIVEGLNPVFRHVLRKTSDAIYEAETQDLKHPGAVDGANKDTGSIRKFTLPIRYNDKGNEARWKAGPRSDAEARSLAHLLKGIANGTYLDADGKEVYPDIRELMAAGKKAVGILLPGRGTQWKYELCLREAGLPFSSFSGVGFYQSQVVADALALVRFLTDAYQDLACAAVFRSPFVGFSDVALVLMRDEGAPWRLFNAVKEWQTAPHPELPAEDRLVLEEAVPWLMSVRRKVKTVRLSDILHEAFLERPYAVSFADPTQTEANIRKLIRIVRELEQLGTGSLVDVDAFLTRQIDDEVKEKEGVVPNAGSIHFMTIHGSKGLEFPMVVLPALGAPKPSNSDPAVRSPRDVEDSDAWIVPKGVNKEEPDTYYGALFHDVRKQVALREAAEQKRLFYVACTRAKNHLVFWGMENELVGEVKGSLGALLPAGLPPAAHEIPESWIADRFAPPPPPPRLALGDRDALIARLEAADRIAVLPSKSEGEDETSGSGSTGGTVRWKTLEPRLAGDLIHKVLEHVGWIGVDPSTIGRLIRRLWPHRIVDVEDAAAVADHVLRAVAILARLFPDPKLRRHELAFETEVEGSGWVKGIIDLLVQDDRGGWHIVDFKTGGVEHSLEAYTSQLALYAEALRSVSGGAISVPPERRALLSTADGIFLRMNA